VPLFDRITLPPLITDEDAKPGACDAEIKTAVPACARICSKLLNVTPPAVFTVTLAAVLAVVVKMFANWWSTVIRCPASFVSKTVTSAVTVSGLRFTQGGLAKLSTGTVTTTMFVPDPDEGSSIAAELCSPKGAPVAKSVLALAVGGPHTLITPSLDTAPALRPVIVPPAIVTVPMASIAVALLTPVATSVRTEGLAWFAASREPMPTCPRADTTALSEVKLEATSELTIHTLPALEVGKVKEAGTSPFPAQIAVPAAAVTIDCLWKPLSETAFARTALPVPALAAAAPVCPTRTTAWNGAVAVRVSTNTLSANMPPAFDPAALAVVATSAESCNANTRTTAVGAFMTND
jgi:hypothetical protein